MAYREKLGSGLVLRTVENEEDICRYAEFNSTFNNAAEGATCDILLRRHPHVSREEFQLVEDERTGGIVSTTCLIPWLCHYEGVVLKTAMLEMVLTHPEYRRSGIVRLQINRFLKLAEEGGYDLSMIWGIPYYYRQYGYTYCINGNTADILPSSHIPETEGTKAEAYSLRKATMEDVQELEKYHAAAAENQKLHIIRDTAYWHYLIEGAQMPVWLVVDNTNGCAAGYVVYREYKDGCLQVSENGIVDRAVGMAVLRMLKRKAEKEILLNWPENHVLVVLGRSLGSKQQQPGQWLLRIPDIPKFLVKIGPVLEKRLSASGYAGYTRRLVINLFKQAYSMRFEDGRLAGVENIGFRDSSMGADGGDLCIPPDAFLRLVFGFRTLEQLADAWPDIVIKPESKDLLRVLFPLMPSYIHAPYHYQGELKAKP